MLWAISWEHRCTRVSVVQRYRKKKNKSNFIDSNRLFYDSFRLVFDAQIGEDVRTLENGVHFVSGTPGRVYDMIQRRSLRVKHVKILILDEADEMLAQGFKDQVYDIYRYLPSNTQVVVVSATMTPDVLRMTKQFMTAPVRNIIYYLEI